MGIHTLRPDLINELDKEALTSVSSAEVDPECPDRYGMDMYTIETHKNGSFCLLKGTLSKHTKKGRFACSKVNYRNT